VNRQIESLGEWGRKTPSLSLSFLRREQILVIELKEYESATEIAKMLDSEITRTKSMLGEYLRRLDEIRTLAERSKKVRDVVYKLAGKKAAASTLGDITVGDLNVILDATPFHELTAIEEAVRSQQDRLLILQKTRESMKWVDQIEDTEGLKYLVVENDGVPNRILLKIQ
jgi:hypothetical protein